MAIQTLGHDKCVFALNWREKYYFILVGINAQAIDTVTERSASHTMKDVLMQSCFLMKKTSNY